MRGNVNITLLAIILSFYNVYSQCPSVDFESPDSVCIGEPITITNNSINGDYYEWDLCLGDLLLTPKAEEKTTINESATLIGIDVVKSNNKWYGFTTSRDNNSLFRLDFGASLSNQPSIINLGNINNILDQPQDIKILQDNDQWFGFIQCKGNPEFIRINFGSDLTNTNSTADTILSSSGITNNGFDIAYDGNSWVAVLGKSNKITLINFGNFLGNSPGPADITTSTAIIGATSISDISLHKYGNLWYGFMSSFGSKAIHILEFGGDLFNIPSTVLIDNSFLNNEIPFGISVNLDDNILVAFISTLSGKIFRLSFTDGLGNSPTATELGNFGMLNNTLKITLKKDSSNWYAFTPNYQMKKIFQLSFPNNCQVSSTFSYNFQPENVYFNSSGIFNIELRAISNNCLEIMSKSIFVKNIQAPSISFTTRNNCLSSSNTFTATSSDDDSIFSWIWNFGDSSTDSIQSPVHQYTNPGTYPVKLFILAENGCSKFTQDTVRIYSPPVADFRIEDTLLCSNNPLNLVNQTNYTNPDSITSFSWNINDEMMSISKDTSIVFTSGGNKFITLSVSIPGCSSDTTKTFSLLEGPSVHFTFSDVCDRETVFLKNESLGNISGFSWDFGDGYTSTLEDPNHLYELAGNYSISLSAIADNGCVSSNVDTVMVHYLPDAMFLHELPCSRSEIQFYDESSVNEANIIDWEWSYVNLSNPLIEGIDSVQNPAFLFQKEGEYQVSLMVYSNYGCQDSIQKSIEVLPSPVANFTQNQSCIGDTTFFTDESSIPGENYIKHWTWQIESALYEVQSPKHAFMKDGTFHVTLIVQADNLCRDRIVHPVTIHPLPHANFIVNNNCQNETIMVNSSASSLADPITQFLWEIENAGQYMGQSISMRFEDAGDYQISHIVITENGCRDTVTQSFPIYEAPIASFDYSPKYGSIPFEVNFENNSSGAEKYFWDFDHNQATSRDINPFYTYETQGYYNPLLVAENQAGCKDSTYVTIHVTDPVLDVRINEVVESRQNGKVNYLLEIKNSGTIIIDQMDIIINVNGEFIVNETFEETLYAGESIRYPLQFELFDLPNQTPEFICFQLIPDVSGHEEYNPADNRECLTENNQFLIRDPYPNPTNGELFVDMILPDQDDITIQLISNDGNVFWTRKYAETKKGLNSFTIWMDENIQGIYFLRIIYTENVISKRICVIR